MGFFDFLTGKGGGVAKHVQAANAKYGQSADRYAAMERLRDLATDESLIGLLRRFTWNYDKSIEDEQEKEAVHDWMVELCAPSPEGESEADLAAHAAQRKVALRALERSALGSETISWQLRVLSHVTTDGELWPILEKLIAANDNQYARDPSRKIQLIDFLGDSVSDPRAVTALLQWLEDVDETVRFQAVESLFHQKNEEASVAGLLALVVSPDEQSRRIKLRVLDGIADLGWSVAAQKAALEPAIAGLGGSYSIDGKGRLKKGR